MLIRASSALWSFTIIMLATRLAAQDTRGREFFLAFADIRGSDGSTQEPTLYFTNGGSSSVSVAFTTANGIRISDVTVRAQSSTIKPIQGGFRFSGAERLHNGIRITASGGIGVFALNTKRSSTDGALVLPADTLGTDYYAVTAQPPADGYKAQVVIVGTVDNTRVTVSIHPEFSSEVLFQGRRYGPGRVIDLMLDEIEAIQLQSEADLTGTRIYSNKPIAVLSGNDETIIGGDDVSNTNHLTAQLPPLNVWGTEFVVTSFPAITAYGAVRLVASVSGTDIDVTLANGTRVQTAIGVAGDYIDVITGGLGDVILISATRPMLVVQFTRIPPFDGGASIGDSTMVLVPPIEQYANRYYITSPATSFGQLFQNYLVIIARAGTQGGVRINNSPILGALQWVAVDGGDGRALVAAVVSNIAALLMTSVSHVNPAVDIGLLVYGLANGEAYGFPGGMRMRTIDANACIGSPAIDGDGVDNDCDGRVDEEICNDLYDTDRDGYIDEDCVRGATNVPSTTRRPLTTRVPSRGSTSPSPASGGSPTSRVTTPAAGTTSHGGASFSPSGGTSPTASTRVTSPAGASSPRTSPTTRSPTSRGSSSSPGAGTTGAAASPSVNPTTRRVMTTSRGSAGSSTPAASPSPSGGSLPATPPPATTRGNSLKPLTSYFTSTAASGSPTLPGTGSTVTPAGPGWHPYVCGQCETLETYDVPFYPEYENYYVRQSYNYNSRPVFKHKYSDRFLFFVIKPETRFWLFGTDIENERGTILAHKDTQTPVQGSSVIWRVYHSATGRWVDGMNLGLRCKCGAFPECPAIQIRSEYETGRTDHGIFRRTSELLNGRPVFKHISNELYLFYRREANVGSWALSSIKGHPTLALMFVRDGAQNTGADISGLWRGMIDGEWRDGVKVDVECGVYNNAR